mgnify:CR=1 FL=1
MLVHEFLENSTYRDPSKEALICEAGRYKYQDIAQKSDAIMKLLLGSGLKKSDRVIIWLPNSLESAVSIFGILQAGGIMVVVNNQVKPDKLRYIINDCTAKVLITDKQHFVDFKPELDHCKNLDTVVLTDEKNEKILSTNKKEIQIIPFAKEILGKFENLAPPQIIDVDLAAIIYTSGSSGFPKGALFTHQNMVSAASSIIEYLENVPEDIIYNVLPLSFDYGLYQLLMAFKFGGTLVLDRNINYPYHNLKKINNEHITGFPIVPAIANILLKMNHLKEYNLKSLRYITNTGQRLPKSTIYGLREAFPGVKIYSMYGLTECKRVSYLPPEKLDQKPGSVGQAMPNTEAFIIDENGDRIEEAGEIGELVVRGASMMVEYWKNPEATSKVIKEGKMPGDRWLYTGDLFQRDEDGDLYFYGRKDDIIKKLGEKVSPREIESVLYKLDGISEAAVIGIPDEITGKTIVAVVSLEEDSGLQERDIIQHCKNYLESFKIPKYIDIRSSLPLNPNGKFDKKRLVAAHQS